VRPQMIVENKIPAVRQVPFGYILRVYGYENTGLTILREEIESSNSTILNEKLDRLFNFIRREKVEKDLEFLKGTLPQRKR
jgi:hypothetical protein